MLVPLFLLLPCIFAYSELLSLRPLPQNKLLASWNFELTSEANDLNYYNGTESLKAVHYKDFPKSLGPILHSTNTRELHIRFGQGHWDSEEWGRLPDNGTRSGGTGVEIWAVVEAPDVQNARYEWKKLANSLSGLFCASLNFIDSSITTFPRQPAQSTHQTNYLNSEDNNLYLLRAALPSEPVCTENLTPFLKLLPTRGKSGVGSLLEGHKIFDSLWHGLSIDVNTVCNENSCQLVMEQSINAVIDLVRSIRKSKEGGIPKPVPGEDLRCDTNKVFNIWQCFPLSDSTKLSWDLQTIMGRKIKGSAFRGVNSTIKIDAPYYNVTLFKYNEEGWNSKLIEQYPIEYQIAESNDFDFKFDSEDSSPTTPNGSPPIQVTRSFTGYSQDKGGIRVSFKNLQNENVKFTYYEVLPWYMRLYLHTLSMEISGGESNRNGKIDESDFIKSRYYKPAIDRKRPSHSEFIIDLPPLTQLTLNYQFDKSLLLYAEYPPDANHGFTVDPAVVTLFDEENNLKYYELRTTSLLITLPTPDFSMPYNVIILTSTVMALVFGSVFNLLVRHVITEEESDEIAKKHKLAILKAKLRKLLGKP